MKRCGLRLTRTFAATATATRPKPSRPFSIRLSDVERRQLEREAGSQALGTYVRARLLAGSKRRSGGCSAADSAALSFILGKLGRLQLASGLADLAMAAKAGALIITPELEREIRSACRDVHDVRAKLLEALGLRAEARA